MPDITRHAELSEKLKYDDLDWNLAREAGLSDREKQILPYFADIEGQTVFYMLELLKLKAARDPATIAFATIWNYEEYYHSLAFTRLLEVCGCPLESDRLTGVRATAKIRAKIEDAVQVLLSRCLPRTFAALWMMWGASQEGLTLRGYEQLASTTDNPVLRELCLRIAKQERRHFAFYYNAARERLAESRFSQRVVRWVFERAWTPVGEGVKSASEVAGLIANLFPGRTLCEAARQLDDKLGALPGMDGFNVVSDYAESVHELLLNAPPSLEPAAVEL